MALSLATLAMFGLQYLLGGTTDPSAQMRLGMAQPQLFAQGEWFRLVTPMFLHHGAIHLVLNGLAFVQLGALTEMAFGSRRMLTFYLVCGVSSSFTSMMWMNDGLTGSLGASGAIMGLAGILLGSSWYGDPDLRRRLRRVLGRRLLFGVVLTFAIGFGLLLYLPIIDNWGHLGGFVAGLLIAVFRPGRRPLGSVGLGLSGGVTGLTAAALLWMAVSGGASATDKAMATMYRSRAMSNPDGFATGIAGAEMVRAYHQAGMADESLRATHELMTRCTNISTPALMSQALIESPFEQETAAAIQRWMSLDPNDAYAHNTLAWFMVTATSPAHMNPSEALILSQRSIELLADAQRPDPGARAVFMDTEALAWFRMGNPERALQIQSEALELARQHDVSLELGSERLRMYDEAVHPTR